ncbi:MAG: MopE-related protein [Myxococcota bacterium]
MTPLLLARLAAAADVLAYSETFDSYTSSAFSGTGGWVSNCPYDTWAINSSSADKYVYAESDETGGTWGTGSYADNALTYTTETFSDFTYDGTLYSNDDDTIGVVFRYQDASNFYIVIFVGGDGYPSTTGARATPLSGSRLYKVVGGVGTLLDSSAETFDRYYSHEFEIVADGSSIEVWLDGNRDGSFASTEQIMTATDSALTEGEIGFYCFDNGSGTGCAFDDVYVYVPDTDGDTVADVDDNCPDDSNVSQADADGDGAGDACDDDADGDGYTSTSAGGTDCDDTRATVNTAATESCSTAYDDDCDSSTNDPGATGCTTYYYDGDNDGYGTTASQCTCSASGSYDVRSSTDCDDADSTISPVGTETCDGVDEDCDGTADDGAVDLETWHADDDGDGYGDATSTQRACDAPAGYVADDADCDDADADVSPLGVEVCDGVDQDCDGVADDDATDRDTWYLDADNDGYGDASVTTLACEEPSGYTDDADDCDDGDRSVHPGATERCDGVDEDCDNEVDEDAADAVEWYRDADGDGYGDATILVYDCSAPDGYVADATDCDDADATAYPGASETGDGVDDDCDGLVDNHVDTDGDGLEDYTEVTETLTDPNDDDSDDDGLSDGDEVTLHGTDPNDADTDGGGASDGAEVLVDFTDPTDSTDDVQTDTDGDGLTDTDEGLRGTDRNDPDSDDDGLSDGDEVLVHETDPTEADTDGGGALDGDEVASGTDPLDPSDDAAATAGRVGGFWGGACSTTSAPAALFPLALAALSYRRRRA